MGYIQINKDSMDRGKINDDRAPFRELSINTVEDRVANLIERKRERERARYEAITDEQRSEMNRKRRESYQRQKGQSTQDQCNDEKNKHHETHNEDGNDNSDWQHMSNSYEVHKVIDEHNLHMSGSISEGSIIDLTIPCDPPLDQMVDDKMKSKTPYQDVDHNERKRSRERARWAAMSDDRRIEINKRRRDAHQKKKAQSTPTNTDIDENGETGLNKENENPDGDYRFLGGDHDLNSDNQDPADNNDWLHTNMCYCPQSQSEDMSNQSSGGSFRTALLTGSAVALASVLMDVNGLRHADEGQRPPLASASHTNGRAVSDSEEFFVQETCKNSSSASESEEFLIHRSKHANVDCS